MKKIRLLLSTFLLGIFGIGLALPIHAQQAFDDVLEKSVESIQENIISGSGTEPQTDVLRYLQWFIDLITPIVIIAGVAVVFFGAYKMMASDKEEAVKEGSMLIIYGII